VRTTASRPKADQEKADLSRRLDRIEEMLAQVLAKQDESG
jgi:hypothetical protein